MASRLRSRNRFGGLTQYVMLRNAAIAAAQRNGASLWFAGAPADLAGFVWQDSAGTTPATGTDPIGRLTDRAGSNAATQATAANKPTLAPQSNGFIGLQFDGTNDVLTTALAMGGLGRSFTLGATGIQTSPDGNASAPIGGFGAVSNFAFLSKTATTNLAGGGAGNRGESVIQSAVSWKTAYRTVRLISGANARLFVAGALVDTEVITPSGPAVTINIGALNANGSPGRFAAGTFMLFYASATELPLADADEIERFANFLAQGL